MYRFWSLISFLIFEAFSKYITVLVHSTIHLYLIKFISLFTNGLIFYPCPSLTRVFVGGQMDRYCISELSLSFTLMNE